MVTRNEIESSYDEDNDTSATLLDRTLAQTDKDLDQLLKALDKIDENGS